MPQFDKITLGRQARELGFVRDTFEKVCRLAEILSFMEQDPVLADSLALKGGTAINLTIFDLPRLSVDIDLDFSKNVNRDDMLAERKEITDHLSRYMTAAGYTLSAKSKQYHALDSFVYEYTNAGGAKDNLKIEINYMLRCHVLPLDRRPVKLPWLKAKINVLTVAPLEIFAAKIVALLSRTALRDLYDIANLQKYDFFSADELALLRQCTVFYSAIAAEQAPAAFNFDTIRELDPHRIRTDLIPVLRRTERFDLQAAQENTIDFLASFMSLTMAEIEFWQAFNDKNYRPELIFSDPDQLQRIIKHPMAIWKCRNGSKYPWKLS